MSASVWSLPPELEDARVAGALSMREASELEDRLLQGLTGEFWPFPAHLNAAVDRLALFQLSVEARVQ